MKKETLQKLYSAIFIDETCWYAQAKWLKCSEKEEIELLTDDDHDKILLGLYEKGIGLKEYHEWFYKAIKAKIEYWCRIPDNIEFDDESDKFIFNHIRLVQKYLLLGKYEIIKGDPLPNTYELDLCTSASHVIFCDEFYEELLGDRRNDKSFLEDVEEHYDSLKQIGLY